MVSNRYHGLGIIDAGSVTNCLCNTVQELTAGRQTSDRFDILSKYQNENIECFLFAGNYEHISKLLRAIGRSTC